MKVAIVQETVDPQRGGAETSTWEMARHLARLGLDVTIVCRAAPPGVPLNSEVSVLKVPAGGFSRALRTFRFLQGIQRLHLRARFDIVHAVTPCLAANVYQPRGGTYAETVQRSLAPTPSFELFWLKRLGRQFNIRQRFLYRIERTLLQKRQHRLFVAAVSDYVRRQVVEGYGFPADRTLVVFNGVDIAPLTDEEVARPRVELRKTLGLAPDAPLVLFAAHNFRLKGLTEVIRAAALDTPPTGEIPPGPMWSIAVAGRGRPNRYRRLARKLGVAHRVHFVGTATPIREWYAAADVLAHPTWYDPCSRVVLEALTLGLPVVTTRHNGAAEVMELGRHGVVLDGPEDIAGLAAGIAAALQPEFRAACRAAAPRLCEQLSMARHARELKALYQTVLVAESQRTRES